MRIACEVFPSHQHAWPGLPAACCRFPLPKSPEKLAQNLLLIAWSFCETIYKINLATPLQVLSAIWHNVVTFIPVKRESREPIPVRGSAKYPEYWMQNIMQTDPPIWFPLPTTSQQMGTFWLPRSVCRRCKEGKHLISKWQSPIQNLHVCGSSLMAVRGGLSVSILFLLNKKHRDNKKKDVEAKRPG